MIGKLFTKSCCLTFHYPWTNFLGKSSVKPLTQTKEILQSPAIGTKATSEMPVIRGGILLANHQMEFPSRPNYNLWNSKVLVIEQYTVFGIPESKLYSRARDAQMPWPRSSEYKNHFLKVSTCGAFIIHWSPIAIHFARMNQQS